MSRSSVKFRQKVNGQTKRIMKLRMQGYVEYDVQVCNSAVVSVMCRTLNNGIMVFKSVFFDGSVYPGMVIL